MTATTFDFGYRLPWPFDATGSRSAQPRVVADPFASEYDIPRQVAHKSLDLIRQVSNLAMMTRWTNRTLGLVIGVTHPTVAKILKGDSAALSRSQEARERISETDEVVQRLDILAGRNASRLAISLDTPDSVDSTATDYLIDREVTKAYLVAARELRPSRDGRMMSGRNPLDPRAAKIAVFDED